MAWVQPVSWHRRFALFQTQDTFEIYVDELHQVNYATGRTEPGKSGGTYSKACKVPGVPKAPYLCGHKGFSCAINMYNKDESDTGVGCLGSSRILDRLLCSQAWRTPSHKAACLTSGVTHPRCLARAPPPCPPAGLLWPSMPFRLH